MTGIFIKSREKSGRRNKPAFQLGSSSWSGLPTSWASSSLEANLFPSHRRGKRKQLSSWESVGRAGVAFRVSGRIWVQTADCRHTGVAVLLLRGGRLGPLRMAANLRNLCTVGIIITWVLSVPSITNEYQMNQSNLGEKS